VIIRTFSASLTISIERNPMTMTKIRLLIPLLGLLAAATTQGCENSTAVNGGNDGTGGSSIGGSTASASGGAGGSPNTTSHKVTIVGSGT
jgi:hypothetical protein